MAELILYLCVRHLQRLPREVPDFTIQDLIHLDLYNDRFQEMKAAEFPSL